MRESIDKVVDLRKQARYEESRLLALELATKFPNDPITQYQCAWSHDVIGLEKEAVRYYERAIELGLSDDNLSGALLGLGSSYRVLGQYENSITTLKRGLEEFPNSKVFQVFLSMALYNVGNYQESISSLLQLLVETTNDDTISPYKKAIMLYAKDLEKKW